MYLNIPRLSAFFDAFERTVANISLAVLVIILTLQVLFRYLLETGLTWSEELSRFSFVWFVYISASLAAQKGSHIRVTLLSNLFPGGQRYCLLLADGIWVVFNGFVVVSGLLLMGRMIEHPVYSTALFVPLVYVYSVVPLAHALMIVRIVQRQWIAWRTGISVLPSHTDTGTSQP